MHSIRPLPCGSEGIQSRSRRKDRSALAVAIAVFRSEYLSPIKLSDVTIRSENAYTTIFVVALDDKPIDRAVKSSCRSARGIVPPAGPTTRSHFATRPKRQFTVARLIVPEKCPGVVQVTMLTFEVQNSSLKSALFST